MAAFETGQVLVGVTIFASIVLPQWLSDKPLSFPILYVVMGAVLFSLPIGVSAPNPIENPALAEYLTQLVVIIALMGAGLKLDRPFDLREWTPSWRLLGVTMPLTIAATAFLGWWVLGLALPTAVLLGAVIAPTDPVLASDVEATDPEEAVDPDIEPEDQEGEIRFSLTSEAGLNDGLAFPFVYLAIALASISLRAPDVEGGIGGLVVSTLLDWLLMDVFYRIAAGIAVGYVIGNVVARLIFGLQSTDSTATSDLASAMEGSEALAATLLAYGMAELIHGYGFIAVFVSALVLRHFEWSHDYYQTLDDFAVLVERLLMAGVLALFGGTLVEGLLAPLTWRAAAAGLAVVLLVRPLTGMVGLLGSGGTWKERSVIAVFGIKGIGSFYYLAFALHEATFEEFELLVDANVLWAFTGFVVLVSMVVHGVTATPVMDRLDRIRSERGESSAVGSD